MLNISHRAYRQPLLRQLPEDHTDIWVIYKLFKEEVRCAQIKDIRRRGPSFTYG